MSSFASKTLSVFDRIHLRRSGTHEGGSKVTSKTKRNIGIVVAVLVVILLALPFFINVNSFRPKIESELSNALGRKAEVGELSLSVLGAAFLRRTSALRTIRRSVSHPFSVRKA
jgi:hypothetical protein